MPPIRSISTAALMNRTWNPGFDSCTSQSDRQMCFRGIWQTEKHYIFCLLNERVVKSRIIAGSIDGWNGKSNWSIPFFNGNPAYLIRIEIAPDILFFHSIRARYPIVSSGLRCSDLALSNVGSRIASIVWSYKFSRFWWTWSSSSADILLIST